VSRSQDLHCIARYFRSTRHLGQKPAVWAAEPEFAIGLSIDLEALFVNGAMVPAAEQGEIRMGDSIPEFRSRLGGTTSGDRGIFGLLRTARTVFTRSCRPATTALAESCQAENCK
jgi:hypothetical protein